MALLSRLCDLTATFLLNRPLRVKLPQGEGWFYPGARRVLPAIAGADDGDSSDDGSDGGGEDDADGSGEESDDGPEGSDDNGDDAGDDSSDDGSDDEITKLRSELRKHRSTERRAKGAEKKARGLEDKLKKLEDRDKSEQEKALEKAREEAKSQTSSEYEQKIRSSRLEVAITRHASKGIEIEDGDEPKTVRFADAEDALLYIERALDRGDIESDDLFDDDGKVKVDALRSELVNLLESKPHYRAKDSEDKPRKQRGGADAGRGSGPGGETASVEAQLAKIKKHK